MEQVWFEMPDARKKRLNSAVWIPLRAALDIAKEGQVGRIGYREEFFGAGTVAVPLERKSEAEILGWMDVGIAHEHAPRVDEDGYIPADLFKPRGDSFVGVHLVLEQRGNSLEKREWHLHHDLVLGLALKREGDVWLAMNEGYIEVARLKRASDGRPILLEIRAEHLKDFLAARGMALYVTSYRTRKLVAESAEFITWPTIPYQQVAPNERWEGRVTEIHEGSFHPFGAKTAVFHVRHKSVDLADEVPSLPRPGEGETESDSWKLEQEGRKLYFIRGELWKEEWVDPASKSPRIRDDQVPSSVRFIVDAEGQQLGEQELRHTGQWLWFRPEVMLVLANRRGGHLEWYTRDTGGVASAPGSGVHFGVNRLGLINVFAKDVALLPEWQQRIWAGYNVGPDGGVSEELFASQVRADPAATHAPEALLEPALQMLRTVSQREFGKPVVRDHDQLSEIIRTAQRFRAVDRAGLFSLAKDLARVTADTIDATVIHQVLTLAKEDRPGSLKALERLLATRIDPATAREIMGPLVGIYELRHADAHLPGSETDASLALARVDTSLPFVHQGFQLLHVCVTALMRITRVFTPSDFSADKL